MLDYRVECYLTPALLLVPSIEKLLTGIVIICYYQIYLFIYILIHYIYIRL